MKIEFSDNVAAQKFWDSIHKNDNTIVLNGENYLVRTADITHYAHVGISVAMNLIHIPKRTYPKWDYSEDYLKQIRQKHSSLLKYTEQAFQVFIENGGLTKYLEKYNSDGSEK